jgi:hypothetical protein
VALIVSNECKFKPEEIKGAIGMFHCPECGEMQLAGHTHISSDDIDLDDFIQGWLKKDDNQ